MEAPLPRRFWIDLPVDQPESVSISVPSVLWDRKDNGPARLHRRFHHFPHRFAFGNMCVRIDNAVHDYLLTLGQRNGLPAAVVSCLNKAMLDSALAHGSNRNGGSS